MTVKPGRNKRTDSRYLTQAAVLAAKLKDHRLNSELTQEEVARRAGLPVATVRSIESGRVVEPGYFTIKDIAAALNLSMAELEVQPS